MKLPLATHHERSQKIATPDQEDILCSQAIKPLHASASCVRRASYTNPGTSVTLRRLGDEGRIVTAENSWIPDWHDSRVAVEMATATLEDQSESGARASRSGMTGRAIASAQGMSRKSVLAVFTAADQPGIGRDSIAGRSDAEVYTLLFPGRGEHESVFAQPDWAQLHKELAQVGVTLKLLHGEYVDGCAVSGSPAMSYDRFCKAYAACALLGGAASPVDHKAGQTIEVDWSGPTMQLADPVSGEVSRAYLFVACLPFSRYAFVKPTKDMRQDTWLLAHVAMFEWFGGTAPRVAGRTRQALYCPQPSHPSNLTPEDQG